MQPPSIYRTLSFWLMLSCQGVTLSLSLEILPATGLVHKVGLLVVGLLTWAGFGAARMQQMRAGAAELGELQEALGRMERRLEGLSLAATVVRERAQGTGG